MALVIADRVKDTTTSVGTGTITLSGSPPAGFQSFAAVGDGNTTYYTIAGQGTSEWEVGIGTYTAAGTTLSRDTVLSSSAGGTTKVTFSAGVKDVFVTYPSGKAISDGYGTLPVANGGTGATTLTANNVLLGNGTSALQTVAPGASGNILTSNGTTWTSASPSTYVTLTGVQTLTNKTIEAGSLTNGYTEEVYALAGTEINPANGSIQTKTLSGNTTFTETIADGQSVVLMLNPSTFTTTWPTMSWVSPAGTPSTPPTLKASVVNVIVLWQVGGVLYGVWAGSV